MNTAPWPERLWGALWCPLFGHKPRQKFSCTLCDHCRKVLAPAKDPA